jgi:hypothetical protein
MMIGHAFALFAYSSFSAVSEEERVLLVLEGKAARGSTVEPRYKDTQYKDTRYKDTRYKDTSASPAGIDFAVCHTSL